MASPARAPDLRPLQPPFKIRPARGSHPQGRRPGHRLSGPRSLGTLRGSQVTGVPPPCVSPPVQDPAARVLVRAVRREPRRPSDGAGRGRPDAASPRGAESAGARLPQLQLLRRVPAGVPHQVPAPLPSGPHHPPAGRGRLGEVSAGCRALAPSSGSHRTWSDAPCVCFCRCPCYVAAQYSVRWSHESEFSRILIGPKMLTDHMPDILMRALDRVVSDRAACVSCAAQGGSSLDVA